MQLIIFICILVVSEVIVSFIFSGVAQFFYQKNGINSRSIIKGLFERGFLFVVLINGFPHALTLFGALKVATRLKRDSEGKKEEEESYNNFYLIGNFISVMVAIGYVIIYESFFSKLVH